MGEQEWRDEQRQGEIRVPDERDGGLIDLLRRLVAPRPSEVLVMERDGQIKKVEARNEK
jgi:hypothetical protein